MLTRLALFFRTHWQRLTLSQSSRRLSWFSLILVFLIDAYVLSLLFDGLNRTARLIDAPHPKMNRHCVDLTVRYLQEGADEGIRSIEWFGDRVSEDRQNAIDQFDEYVSGRHPMCDQVRDKLLATVSDPTLSKLFLARKQQLKEIEEIKAAISKLESTYGNALLEKIANQKRSDSITPVEAGKMKVTLDDMNATLEKTQRQRDETRASINEHPAIKAYTAYLQTLPVVAAYQSDQELYETARAWYPVKIFAAQTGFLLPLLLLAVLWNRQALDKQRDTSIMVSSHLILVGGIPIALRLLQLMREFLPEELLGWLLYKLEQWHISFLWYYGLIFASVGAGLLLIFIAQRTFFTPSRQRMRRLLKVLCRSCGEKLRHSEQAWCEICGADQLTACGKCSQPHRMIAFHCSHCGKSQPAAE
ncbi:hypothetical protein SAMN05428959_1011022 [Duganella sp. CF517]|uniref:hypothetical protein n=1 Tax=Duganella sp. CF517 TaxID=1881038 RepID=UPI0008CBC104|nr:hypothetical protein [Duganella sp. CF517]SEN28711.1 hypothetical protein SAMN05428959_1011022 [Duganella sp. CF517]